MANTLYDLGRQAFLEGAIAWLSDTIKAAMVDTGVYTFSQSHQYYSSISSAVIGTPQALGSKSSTSGVADAADVTFTAVSGSSVEAIVIYQDTGNPATSRLIAYMDTATGLPFTPTGADESIVWDNGSNKVFKL